MPLNIRKIAYQLDSQELMESDYSEESGGDNNSESFQGLENFMEENELPPQLAFLINNLHSTHQENKIQKQLSQVKMEEPQDTPNQPFELNEENGTCKICYKYAINAVVCNHEKCQILMCGHCASLTAQKNGNTCPFCRNVPFSPKPYRFRRAINKIQLMCTLCHQKYILEEEQKHYKKCSYFFKVQCRYCPERMDKQNIVKHTRMEHPDKLDSIIEQVYSNQGSYNASELLKQKEEYFSKMQRSPHLGTTGKFYCGNKLEPPKCTCCNGYCGPTNGENCEECMKLDILRLRLPKGYLLNSNGHVCWRQGNQFVCNVMQYYGQNFCKQQYPCRSCANMTKNIKRYQKLL